MLATTEQTCYEMLQKGQNSYSISFFFFSGMKMQSKILEDRYFLFSHLRRFLNTVPGSHSWELCYRASSYGWSSSTFHSYCDGKPHTVTIIRKNEYVFGGYSDIPWGMYTADEIYYLKYLTCFLTVQKFRNGK